MRHRYRKLHRSSVAFETVTAHPVSIGGSVFEWFATGDSIPTNYTTGPDSSSLMTDELRHGNQHTNYIDHESLQSPFGYFAPGPVLVNRLDLITDNSLTGNRYESYPIEALVRNSNIFLENPFPAKKLEKLLNLAALPYSIDIKKDPFDTDFSIWYLLVDLYDLLELYKHIFNGKLQRLQPVARRSKTATARQIADTHLSLQFGFEATIKDMQSFYSILMHWRERYDDVYTLTHTDHYWRAKPFDMKSLVPPLQNRSGVVNVDGTLVPTRIDYRVDSCVFNRSMIYRFVCPEFSGWMARIRQFIDAFGIVDPAAIWDVIPFTFVVDWFVNIGEWLHRNRPKLYQADVAVQDYCESINLKYHAVCELTGIVNAPARYDPTLVPSTSEITQIQFKTYIRRRFCAPPEYISLPARPLSSFLRTGRAGIVAALLAQRVLPRGPLAESVPRRRWGFYPQSKTTNKRPGYKMSYH